MRFSIENFSAYGQPAPIPSHKQSYKLESGTLENVTSQITVPFRKIVRASKAPWLQLHFDGHNLGNQSYITITSIKDGGQQRLDSKTIREWQNSTAIFNGDAVELKLHIAPGDENIFVHIKEITVGDWVGDRPIQETLCAADDRTGSGNAGVARINNGCTGWSISNGGFLTAGHCVGGMTIIEFNVPPSLCDGTIVASAPNDQYAIRRITDFANNGQGDDWAIFSCFPNPNTRLFPAQAYGAFFRMSLNPNPATVEIAGYGVDNTPRGCRLGRNAQNQTQQTNAGTFLGQTGTSIEYTVDTEPGNSGSPVIDLNVTIGIHTHGGCNPPRIGNFGTSFGNADLQDAIQDFPSEHAVYVDRDRPMTIEDGTVFRPFDKIEEGLNSASAGDTVIVVTGSYNEKFTVTKKVTLMAPVGNVTIGR